MAAAQPLPLGTLVTTSATDPSCPAGHTCTGFQVSCPGVQLPARGFLATASSQGTPRGLVVISTGGGGTSWFTGQSSLASGFVNDLRADGFVVVQLRWVDAWLVSAQGEDAGSGHLACRPATVFKWVHDNQYLPLGIGPGEVGRCGFCITGNSGGASQSSYALSHYGLDSILDAVVPTGGPPHAAQAKGCLRNAGEEAYWYAAGSAGTIDSSYGFQGAQGPCALHDPSFVPRWDAESVDTGGNDYVHLTTRVHVILGGNDTSSAPAHARDYVARLRAAESPYVTQQVVPGMPHAIGSSADGLAALHAALLASIPSSYPRPVGASPMRVSLVPAFKPCNASLANASHQEPLSGRACNPPSPVSSQVAVGARSLGFIRMRVLGIGECAPNPPTACYPDVVLAGSVTDVRSGTPTGPDYDRPGANRQDLTASATIPNASAGSGTQITDGDNRLAADPTGPYDKNATVVPLSFPIPLDCTPTADPAVGSTCDVRTTANTLVPGSAVAGKRAIWELGQIQLLDQGPNGTPGDGDDRVFETQGVFVP